MTETGSPVAYEIVPPGRTRVGGYALCLDDDRILLARLSAIEVDVGAWTLPIYLRRLNGAVYTDVGDAFTFDRRDFKLHAGAGAELRAEVVLGWILPTDLRLGCARGLERSPLAIFDCFLALGGVF